MARQGNGDRQERSRAPGMESNEDSRDVFEWHAADRGGCILALRQEAKLLILSGVRLLQAEVQVQRMALLFVVVGVLRHGTYGLWGM